MIDFLFFWILPLLGGVVGTTLAMFWHERRASKRPNTFEIVSDDSIAVTDRNAHERFLSRYFDTLAVNIERAERSITIVDYLAHHRSLNAQDDESLGELYEEYFLEVERVVKEKKLEYVRIVQLPLPRVARDRSEKIAESLSLMFLEAFRHLDRLLNSSENFKFYVLNAAFRPYSFIIVDDVTILTEYDRYNSQGKSIADHIIVNSAKRGASSSPNPEVMELIETQKRWCSRLIRREMPVTLDEFRSLAPRLKQKNLPDVEVNLGLTAEEFQEFSQLFAGPDFSENSIRNILLHDPEAVRKNARGSQKKLEIVSSSAGAVDVYQQIDQ